MNKIVKNWIKNRLLTMISLKESKRNKKTEFRFSPDENQEIWFTREERDDHIRKFGMARGKSKVPNAKK